jgi:predicted lipoprotein with Yx(FWY)xxD motif
MLDRLRVAVIATALLTATAALAATSQPARSAMTAAAKVSTKKLPKLGVVLVDGRGRTLYMFVPDKRAKVTCLHACAVIWPPMKIAKGQKASVAGQAKASLIGSDANPSGGRVVTYNGWPLYTYITDTSAGTAKGQALNLNGGLWYVLSPSGKVIRTKP